MSIDVVLEVNEKIRNLQGQVHDLSDQDWSDFASCKGVDPEIFYPTGSGGRGKAGQPSDKDTEAAERSVVNRICASCPVQLNCIAHAYNTREEYGVWGSTAKERKRMRRRLKYQRHVEVEDLHECRDPVGDPQQALESTYSR